MEGLCLIIGDVDHGSPKRHRCNASNDEWKAIEGDHVENQEEKEHGDCGEWEFS
jgi:hypothetical protein